MKLFNSLKQALLALGTIVALGLFVSSPALAQQFIVINNYQELPDKKNQLTAVIDREVIKNLSGVQGLRWKRFFYDSSTGERGSVLVFEDKSNWQNYLQSDLRKALVNKIKPFIQGEVSSKGYTVHNQVK